MKALSDLQGRGPAIASNTTLMAGAALTLVNPFYPDTEGLETYPVNKFAKGNGSNILTVICASPRTFEDAKTHPKKYDLLRVRMGGWSEFFTVMFPAHQQQHQRRPLHTPDKAKGEHPK